MLLSQYPNPEIIPRGFGGIRTTIGNNQQLTGKIIPRGFGGIRTTVIRLQLT